MGVGARTRATREVLEARRSMRGWRGGRGEHVRDTGEAGNAGEAGDWSTHGHGQRRVVKKLREMEALAGAKPLVSATGSSACTGASTRGESSVERRAPGCAGDATGGEEQRHMPGHRDAGRCAAGEKPQVKDARAPGHRQMRRRRGEAPGRGRTDGAPESRGRA
jgi:hypothetical protein